MGYLEVAVRDARADKLLGARAGMKVELMPYPEKFSRSLGGSFGEGNAIAETLEPANGLAGDVGALALVEVIGAEGLEDDAIVEQGIENGEEAMGDCEQGPLPSPAGRPPLPLYP